MITDIMGGDKGVAEAAWTSTTSKAKMQEKTDEDRNRVIRTLIREEHTSPLEQAVIQFRLPASELAARAVPQLRSHRFVAASLLKDGGLIGTMNMHALMKLRSKAKLFGVLWQEVSQRPELAIVTSEVNSPGTVDIAPAPRIKPAGKAMNALENRHRGHDQIKVEFQEYMGDANLLNEIVDDDEDRLKHVVMRFHLRCPIFVSRQFMRYRGQSPNELSGRYRTMPSEFLTPPDDVLAIAEKVTGSGEQFDTSFQIWMKDQYNMYAKWLDDAKKAEEKGEITNAEFKRWREFVRALLGTGFMTEIVTTLDLQELRHICHQRLSSHAQAEIRNMVGKMLTQVRNENFANNFLPTLGG